MKKAIVLLSGGQDSTTCLFWAMRKFEVVEALAFDYGQKHKVELEQAAHIAEAAGVELTIKELGMIFAPSGMNDPDIDVNTAHAVNSDLPSTFTAGRNALFLTLAAARAHQTGAKHIVTGVCQTDYSGYPDCRDLFIKSMQVSLSLAMDTDFVIHTPLMWLTKAETWKLAGKLGIVDIIIHDTHTDYNGNREQLNDWGYGKEDNPASNLRAKGFREAKKKGWI